jgi:outer membrane immunogenic protein
VNNAFFGAFQLPVGYRDETRVDALASITGRVGYAWDRFLGYVKGGYAWERDRYRIIDPFNVTVATAGETRGGWTAGIGGEYAFTNNISAFLEYNYYDFGTQRNTFRTVVGAAVFDIADIRETKSVVKAGINFRWGPGGAVVAKY